MQPNIDARASARRHVTAWLVAVGLGCGCGSPPAPKSWAPAKVDNAESAAEHADAKADANAEQETAGPPVAAKKKPRELWARHNAKRLDELAQTVELSPEEREKIMAMWANERTEILRLLLTERNQGKPDWAMVHRSVVELRATNDKQVETWLGPRFAAYEKIRPQGPTLPKVPDSEKPEPEPEPETPDDRDSA